MLQCSRYEETGKATKFNEGAAVVISGIWDYQTAKDILGNNLGIAKLPSFKVNGKSYQMRSYLGSKLLGISPQTDVNKAAALSLLAQYLTNETSQMARFEAFGWRPSVLSAQSNEAVLNHEALVKLLETATVHQGQYPFGWWSKAETLNQSIEKAKGDTGAMEDALKLYSGELDDLLTN